jgi:hypothetical protein
MRKEWAKPVFKCPVLLQFARGWRDFSLESASAATLLRAHHLPPQKKAVLNQPEYSKSVLWQRNGKGDQILW